MLMNMIQICRIIMSFDMAAKTEGQSKPNHCTFGVIEVDAWDAHHHEFLPFFADQFVG